MRLSIVIPVYNEVRTIAEVISRVRCVELPPDVDREIVVVDDGSNDGSREVLSAASAGGLIRLVLQPTNRGKGAALRAGFAAARGDVIVVQDADFEYDPRDLGALLHPLIGGQADVVFGTRFAGTGPRRVLFFWHVLCNRFLTLLSNATTGLNLTDMEVGYKAFRREVLSSFEVESERFGVEPELTAKVALGKWRVYEVPISYCGRSYVEGKKIGWRDGVDAMAQIFRFGVWGRVRMLRDSRGARRGVPLSTNGEVTNGHPRAASGLSTFADAQKDRPTIAVPMA